MLLEDQHTGWTSLRGQVNGDGTILVPILAGFVTSLGLTCPT